MHGSTRLGPCIGASGAGGGRVNWGRRERRNTQSVSMAPQTGAPSLLQPSPVPETRASDRSRGRRGASTAEGFTDLYVECGWPNLGRIFAANQGPISTVYITT